jgi:hypothetical protein
LRSGLLPIIRPITVRRFTERAPKTCFSPSAFFTPEGEIAMDALIAVLSVWIALQTGLSAPPPPRVVHVHPDALRDLAMNPNAQKERLRALYGRGDRIIYLRTNWDGTALADRSELVHELVHHFQNVYALPYSCNAARETLAYNLQIQWLREQGVADPHDLLQTNEFFIVMTSVCRDENFD